MSLSTGTQIGPYTIGDEIGSGGMGVVYRATDQNLKRDVAIKALPESFSADADWVARFEREAQTLAALNHPNIAQIYGLERSDSTTVLVMELVEGPTLADRIADGPLPPDEALGIAMQIADALEAAHGQGIVHRDLKPANIKLRSDGTVKVLDFGIAKTLDIRAASGQPAAMTTPAMTQTGIILGTAAYMSPEQARGKPVDERTDVWAFGCLLYEMLTGQPAFAGEDVAITLARILANDTNMKSLSGKVSPAVRHTIELCLRKDERKRLSDIRDVRLALDGDFDSATGSVLDAGSARSAIMLWITPVIAAVLVTTFVTVIAAWSIWPRAEPQAVNRFIHPIPDGEVFRFPGESVMDLSRDGRQFIFNTESGLYLRTLNDIEARVIPGTEGLVSAPVFSPNGQEIVFWEAGLLKRKGVGGGAAVTITSSVEQTFGLSWEANGRILAGARGGILRVAANGGTFEKMFAEDWEGEVTFFPRLLPDGDSILFSARANGVPPSEGRIVVQSMSSGEWKELVSGGFDARYISTGHLLYAFEDGLFAVPFDLETLTVLGGAVPLAQGVMRSIGAVTAAANYSVSDDGTLVYVEGSVESAQRTLAWVERDGRETLIEGRPRPFTTPRISPDGSRLAVNPRDQESDIWIMDLQRETLSRLTFDPGEDEFPAWSRDGRYVAFSSSRGGGTPGDTELYWKAADGSGGAEHLASYPGQIFPTSFAPDSNGLVAYGTRIDGGGDDDIIVFDFDQSEPRLLLASEYSEAMPEISTDGNWLAYVSDESGREEVYVRPYPDVESGARYQISEAGGTFPLWSPTGEELFFMNAGAVMVVSIQLDPTFSIGNIRQLFTGDFAAAQGGRPYDVMPDGQRFVMLKTARNSGNPSRIIIVENWFEELRQLVPVPE